MSATDSKRAREVDEDDNSRHNHHVDERWSAERSRYIFMAACNPPMMTMPRQILGTTQRMAIQASFPSAASSGYTADGIVWLIGYSGGSSIMHTLLALANAAVTYSGSPLHNVAPGGAGYTAVPVLKFAVNTMVPASSTLSNSTISVGNDSNGQFFYGKLLTGSVDVIANTTSIGSGSITGDIFAAWVGDLRGILDFNRATLQSRALLPRHAAGGGISTGIRMSVPPLCLPYQLLGRQQAFDTPAQKVFNVGQSSPLNTTSPISTVFISPFLTDTNGAYPSVCFATSNVLNPPTNVTGVNLNQALPWGCIPIYDVKITAVGGSQLAYTAYLRITHIFLTAGSTILMSAPQEAQVVVIGVTDQCNLRVKAPVSFSDITTNGIYAGTYLQIDYASSYPTTFPTSYNFSIDVLVSETDENRLASPLVMRLDNVASAVNITCSGNAMVNLVAAGSNAYVTQSSSYTREANPSYIFNEMTDWLNDRGTARAIEPISFLKH